MIKVKIKNFILSGKLENNNLGNKREEILTELNEKIMSQKQKISLKKYSDKKEELIKP